MSSGMWRAVYDSVAGTSHSGTGIPCQDSCRVVHLPVEEGALLVVCCADGAGSATYSADGAEIACDTFVRIIENDCRSLDIDENLSCDNVLEWLREMRFRIEERANALRVEIRELASTFLAAVIGESTALFIQIGDGAIVVRNGDDYRPVFWPQSGEFANTTNFLTDDRFAERVEWNRLSERVDELAVFSDGLERLVLRFADRSVHRPFLEPFFAALRQAENSEEYFEPLRLFLGSPKVNERTDDDKTLILATRLSQCSDSDAVP